MEPPFATVIELRYEEGLLNQRIDKVFDVIDEHKDLAEAGRTELSTRILALLARMESLDGKMSILEARASLADSQLEQLEKRTTNIETYLATMD